MNGNTFGKAVAFLLVAGLAGGAVLYLDVNSKRKSLSEASNALAKAREDLAATLVKVAEARQKIQNAGGAVEQNPSLVEPKQSLDRAVPALEAVKAGLLEEFISHVHKVRSNAVGQKILEIRLENGQLLQDATFQKIADAEVSITHSKGVSRIPWATLPSDLKARFRYGMMPMNLATPPPPPPSALVMDAPAAVATPEEPLKPVALSGTDSQKVSGAEASIRPLEAQRLKLSQTKDSYLRQVADYRQKDGEAKLVGRKSRYAEIIPKLDAAIAEHSQKIAEISAQIANLQIEIENIKSKPN